MHQTFPFPSFPPFLSFSLSSLFFKVMLIEFTLLGDAEFPFCREMLFEINAVVMKTNKPPLVQMTPTSSAFISHQSLGCFAFGVHGFELIILYNSLHIIIVPPWKTHLFFLYRFSFIPNILFSSPATDSFPNMWDIHSSLCIILYAHMFVCFLFLTQRYPF